MDGSPSSEDDTSNENLAEENVRELREEMNAWLNKWNNGVVREDDITDNGV